MVVGVQTILNASMECVTTLVNVLQHVMQLQHGDLISILVNVHSILNVSL